MNYIREAENVLWYYRDLKRSIDNLDRQISRLVAKNGPSVLSAVAADETGIRAGKHDDAMNTMLTLQKLTESRQKTEQELKKIDCILAKIEQDPQCQNFGLVLKLWYIDRVPKEDIGEKLGYARRSVYDIRFKAIRKFAVMYLGFNALEAL